MKKKPHTHTHTHACMHAYMHPLTHARMHAHTLKFTLPLSTLVHFFWCDLECHLAMTAVCCDFQSFCGLNLAVHMRSRLNGLPIDLCDDVPCPKSSSAIKIKTRDNLGNKSTEHKPALFSVSKMYRHQHFQRLSYFIFTAAGYVMNFVYSSIYWILLPQSLSLKILYMYCCLCCCCCWCCCCCCRVHQLNTLRVTHYVHPYKYKYRYSP